MADEKVSIIVELVDRASEGLKKIASSAADFDKATESSKKFAAGIAAIGVAVGAGLVYAVAQAREAAAGQKELNAVLLSTNGIAGMTADAVNNLATELSRATNFTDDEVLSAENMLLTFTKIGSDVFPAATEATLNLAQKFGSVDGASVQLGKALNDPITGVTALRKVGVALSADQEEQIKKFMELGDIASAQKVILDELGTEFGNLARASADPLTQAKNQFGEIAEAIGAELLPQVEAIAAQFLVWMDSMGGVEGIMQKIKDVIAAVAPWLPIISGAIIGALVPAMYALATAVYAATVPLLPWLALGAGVALVIMGIRFAIDHWGEAMEWVKEKLVSVRDSALETLGNIRDFFVEIFTSIASFTADIMGVLITVITFPLYFMAGLFITALEAMGVDWETVWGRIKEFATNLWEGLKGAFTLFIEGIKLVWNTGLNVLRSIGEVAWSGIKLVFGGAWDVLVGMFNLGKDIISGSWGDMWSTLSSAATVAWDAVKVVVRDSVNWVIDKINAMIAAVNGITGKVKGPQLPLIPALNFATGGVVPGIDFRRRGTDTVPAMLTPGERVLTRSQNAAYEAGMGTRIEINIVGTSVFDTDDVVTKLGDPIINVLKQHFAI